MAVDIGIDKMGMYIPPLYMDMVDLAHARDEDPEKYTIGLGQEKMAVPPITQDVISMAANAALQILDDEDRQQIDLVIFATESAIDQSKAGAVYLHQLTGIQPFARSIEMKQACYAATAGLQLAASHITNHPGRKALVLASDIAKYGLHSSGETTQGAGAIAMVVSEQPRLASIDSDSVTYTRDIMDFWRPNYAAYPEVKGRYSSIQYLDLLSEVWQAYQDRQQVAVDDFSSFIFHLPFTKLGQKGLRKVMKGASEDKKEELKEHFEYSRYFSKQVGNIYTGSLYLSLLSSLIMDPNLKARDRIGAYSYGSGAVGEFFSLSLVEGFQDQLPTQAIHTLFENREQVSVDYYEKHYLDQLVQTGENQALDTSQDESPVVLAGIENHERQYSVNKNK